MSKRTKYWNLSTNDVYTTFMQQLCPLLNHNLQKLTLLVPFFFAIKFQRPFCVRNARLFRYSFKH